jgi:hypothetical protein
VRESCCDPFSGEAGVPTAAATSPFRYTAHTINLDRTEPEIEIDGPALRALFRFSGDGGTPYPNQRVPLESLLAAAKP